MQHNITVYDIMHTEFIENIFSLTNNFTLHAYYVFPCPAEAVLMFSNEISHLSKIHMKDI